ncbi:MAG: hypothetical protein QM779_16815 [Propionicimonas sp.]|uniref:hypothetical protein n=1 Tax=Propionicimonas sp. TaxID=1955623 RepID=UPI003D0EDB0E
MSDPGFLEAVLRAIGGVLGLDTSTAEWFVVYPRSYEVAITVAVVAGVSTLLGDSMVLFFNRVRGWRFAFSLLLNGVAVVGLYALQAVFVYLLGMIVVGGGPGFGWVLRGVMLSTAPLVFGVFALIPYFGPAIARFLQAWGVVALWVIVAVMFRTNGFLALVIAVGSWLVMQLLSWLFARPVAWIGNRIWKVVTGKPFMMTGRDLLAGHPFMPLGHQVEDLEEVGR